MKKVFIPLLTACMLGACGNSPSAGDYTPMPRRRAFPRMELYPASYSPVRMGKLVLEVNDSAIIEINGNWVDISYPAYGLTVNCTVTSTNAQSVGQVIDNRTERMALNSGGTPGSIVTFTSESGLTASLLEATGPGGLTPLQFLATDSQTVVLSGAVTAEFSDSIRPALQTVRADLLHLLKKL